MPTSTFDDGSPRYDHGHDEVTGETWWHAKSGQPGSVRTCPACQHEHPVGTTCRECPACPPDPVADAAMNLTDMLPGGADLGTVKMIVTGHGSVERSVR